MYKLSYEKCVCFIFLVILVFLSCSGFHTDRLVTLTDHNNKKYPFTSSSYSLNENAQHERDSELIARMVLDSEAAAATAAGPAVWGAWPAAASPATPGPRRRRRARPHPHRHPQPATAAEHSITAAAASHRTRKAGARRRAARFCPGQDVATRAYKAKTIIEGRVRSRTNFSAAQRSTYAVTVEVRRVHRNEAAPRALNVTEKIRLHFAVVPAGARPRPCAHRSVDGLVRVLLDNGKDYIFFLEGTGMHHNYTVLGPPVPVDPRSSRDIHDVVTGRKVKPAKIQHLLPTNTTLNVTEELKLTCIVRGNPPPIVHWYKDGSEIRNKGKERRIRYMEKKSVLSIPSVLTTDAGRYECRARGVIGKTVSSTAVVSIAKDDIEGVAPCPSSKDGYCLNGGTCQMITQFRELVCSCSTGYNGLRCENKDVSHTESPDKVKPRRNGRSRM